MINPILLAELNRIMGGALPAGMYGGTQAVGGPITGGAGAGSNGSNSGSGGSGSGSDDMDADETITVSADGTTTTTSVTDDGTTRIVIEFPNGSKVETTRWESTGRALVVVEQPNGDRNYNFVDRNGNITTGQRDAEGNFRMESVGSDGSKVIVQEEANGRTTLTNRSENGIQETRIFNPDQSYSTETRAADGTLLNRRVVDANGNGEVFRTQPDGLKVTLQIREYETVDGQTNDQILSGTVENASTSPWEQASGAARGMVDWIINEAIDVWNRPTRSDSVEPLPSSDSPKGSIVQFSINDKTYVLKALRGTVSGDYLTGGRLIAGFEGADTLIGSNSDDILDGGEGADILNGSGGRDNLRGGELNDRLIGGADSDDLDGGAGDDVLEGGAGADILQGGAGWDFASYASAGIGVVVNLSDPSRNLGHANGDRYDSIEGVHGSQYGDHITGTDSGNDLYGHEGDDVLVGAGGGDYLVGGGGTDVIEGGTGGDTLVGGSGYDYVSYGSAASGVTVRLMSPAGNTGEAAGDTYESIEGLHGSGFDDLLGGDAEGNYLFGRAGSDTLYGEGGTDGLFGEDGSDNLVGGLGADALDGGAGFDYAGYFTATAGVTADLIETWRNSGEAQGDSYTGIEGLGGTAYGDDLRGSHMANELYGNAGNDLLEGRGGADLLHGGDGEDYAAYWSASTGVRASLLNSAINTGDAAGDTFVSIEGLLGSGFGDMLQGNGAGNLLKGNEGNDELRGEGGADWMVGGLGHDTLVGGEGADWLEGNAGADLFRFEMGLGNVDQVADFNGSEGDRIGLSTNLFRAFAPVVVEEGYTLNGTLKSVAFTVATGASTTAHRIVYNQVTGALSYDADGVGGSAQVQFAQLKAGTALSAAHFQMFTL